MIAAGVTALFLASGAFAASAAPDPDGPAKKGLCTAYFNGSERGQTQKRKAGPFQALETAASDGDSSTPAEDDVRTFCAGMIGGRAGNPDKDTPGGGKP